MTRLQSWLRTYTCIKYIVQVPNKVGGVRAVYSYNCPIIKTHPRSQDGSQQHQRVPTTAHSYN